MIRIDDLIIPTNRFDITDTFEDGHYYINASGIEEHIWKYKSTGNICHSDDLGDDVSVTKHYVAYLSYLIDTSEETPVISKYGEDENLIRTYMGIGEARNPNALVPDYQILTGDFTPTFPCAENKDDFYPVSADKMDQLEEAGFEIYPMRDTRKDGRTVVDIFGIKKEEFDTSLFKKDMKDLSEYQEKVFEIKSVFRNFRKQSVENIFVDTKPDGSYISVYINANLTNGYLYAVYGDHEDRDEDNGNPYEKGFFHREYERGNLLNEIEAFKEDVIEEVKDMIKDRKGIER